MKILPKKRMRFDLGVDTSLKMNSFAFKVELLGSDAIRRKSKAAVFLFCCKQLELEEKVSLAPYKRHMCSLAKLDD